MKKAVLVMIMTVMLIALFASCNKSVCPAYVKDNTTGQTENNG